LGAEAECPPSHVDTHRAEARCFETRCQGRGLQTGMSFGAWRQQLRLLRALERLAAGEAVSTLALELGYASPSAFIAMFKRALGVPPGRYFDAGQ
jgi:AraC-like DNA-binding protein